MPTMYCVLGWVWGLPSGHEAPVHMPTGQIASIYIKIEQTLLKTLALFFKIEILTFENRNSHFIKMP